MDISLAEVNEDYQKSLGLLKNASSMLQASSEKSYKESTKQLAKAVDEFKLELGNIKKNVERERQQLRSLEDLKTQSTALLEHLQYSLDNVPSKISQQKSAPAPNINKENAETKKPSAPQMPQIGCSYLDFLTVYEFQNIPKYMKGRLTYERVNSIIESLDKVFTEKYKIRRLKKSSLNDMNKKRYEAYRLQENAETKGIHFIVEQDIPDFSSLKVDNVLRNIFTILRHCGMLFEIRGGGYIRYACHERY